MSIQSFAWLGQGFVFFDVMGSNQNLKEKIQNYFQHQFMDLIVTTPTPPHQKSQWAKIVELIA